jgi:hypothetical protein
VCGTGISIIGRMLNKEKILLFSDQDEALLFIHDFQNDSLLKVIIKLYPNFFFTKTANYGNYVTKWYYNFLKLNLLMNATICSGYLFAILAGIVFTASNVLVKLVPRLGRSTP